MRESAPEPQATSRKRPVRRGSAALTIAITCDPHYAAAHYKIWVTKFPRRRLELSIAQLPSSRRKIKSDFADAFVAMANTLDSLGRPAEAVDSYEARARHSHPGYAEVHFNLGLLATAQGRHEDAVKSLRRRLGD